MECGRPSQAMRCSVVGLVRIWHVLTSQNHQKPLNSYLYIHQLSTLLDAGHCFACQPGLTCNGLRSHVEWFVLGRMRMLKVVGDSLECNLHFGRRGWNAGVWNHLELLWSRTAHLVWSDGRERDLSSWRKLQPSRTKFAWALHTALCYARSVLLLLEGQ